MKWFEVTITGRVEADNPEQALAIAHATLKGMEYLGGGGQELPEYVIRMMESQGGAMRLTHVEIGEEVLETE